MEYGAGYMSSRGSSRRRVNKVVFTLVNWRRFIGPSLSNTMTSICKGISNLDHATKKTASY